MSKNSAELFMELKKKVESLGGLMSNGCNPQSVESAHSLIGMSADLLVVVTQESNESILRELLRKAAREAAADALKKAASKPEVKVKK